MEVKEMIGKEIKIKVLVFFADMIIYVRDLKDFTSIS